ncbi:MAG TPA: carbohydrate kinase [Steroidobacteraceae bacterium]|nr:carbohydrate kinase [Steroidobacteraceae bacterium]
MSDAASTARRPPPVVVCFGEALIDLLARPGAGRDAPRQFLEYAGGAPANVAVGVARLGGAARFIGMLAEDMFGERLLAQLAAAGVDVSCVRRTAAANTALAFVALDAAGERSFSFYRPPAADLLFRAEHFDARAFEDAAFFHVCSNSLTEPGIAAATLTGMRRARAGGALVSMDLNLRPALWPPAVDPLPQLWEALREADVVKLSQGELALLAGSASREEAVLARLLDQRAQCVLLTAGAAPLRWVTRGACGSVAAFDVRAIDTTGAGDAFVAGWLKSLATHGVGATTLGHFLADRARLTETLRFAAACGALATTRHGAFAAMPDAAEVEQLLGQR